MKSTVIWDVAIWRSLKVSRCFGEMYWSHPQRSEVSQASNHEATSSNRKLWTPLNCRASHPEESTLQDPVFIYNLGQFSNFMLGLTWQIHTFREYIVPLSQKFLTYRYICTYIFKNVHWINIIYSHISVMKILCEHLIPKNTYIIRKLESSAQMYRDILHVKEFYGNMGTSVWTVTRMKLNSDFPPPPSNSEREDYLTLPCQPCVLRLLWNKFRFLTLKFKIVQVNSEWTLLI
jgi:hypothetical protein